VSARFDVHHAIARLAPRQGDGPQFARAVHRGVGYLTPPEIQCIVSFQAAVFVLASAAASAGIGLPKEGLVVNVVLPPVQMLQRVDLRATRSKLCADILDSTLRELCVHRNRGVQQLGNGASGLGCLDGLLESRLVGVRDLHGRLQVARGHCEAAVPLIQ
jgi:hypothetical protein